MIEKLKERIQALTKQREENAKVLRDVTTLINMIDGSVQTLENLIQELEAEAQKAAADQPPLPEVLNDPRQ